MLALGRAANRSVSLTARSATESVVNHTSMVGRAFMAWSLVRPSPEVVWVATSTLMPVFWVKVSASFWAAVDQVVPQISTVIDFSCAAAGAMLSAVASTPIATPCQPRRIMRRIMRITPPRAMSCLLPAPAPPVGFRTMQAP